MVDDAPATGSRPLVRIAGVGLRVQPAFILVVLILGLAPGRSLSFALTWVVIITVSILVHEAGHAVAFRAYHHDADITLTGFGGLTAGRPRPDGVPLGNGQHVIVSLAGPAAGLLLGLVAVALQRGGTDGIATAAWLDDVILVNVAWGLLNLLPVLPLDGGQVVSSILSMRWPDRGPRMAATVSVAVGAALALGLLAAGYTIGGLMAGALVGMNLGQVGARTRPAGPDGPRLERAVELMHLRRWDAAVDELRRILADGSRSDQIPAAAQLLGWALLGAGRYDAVDEHVNRTRFQGLQVRTLAAVSRLARGDRSATDDLVYALGAEAVDPPGWAAGLVPLDPESVDRLAAACIRSAEPAGAVAAVALTSWLSRGGHGVDALRLASKVAASSAGSAELALIAAGNARAAGLDADAQQWDALAVSLQSSPRG